MTESLKSRYESLKADRSPFLERAREVSELTLAYLYPPEGSIGASDLYQSYQSATGQGLQELASKLTLTLFPVDTTFFRYHLPAETEELEGVDKSKLEAALSDAETTLVEEFNASGARVVLGQAMVYLLCGGSVLLDLEDSPRLHRLDQFVWLRDGAGSYFDIIVEEIKDYRTLKAEFADDGDFLARLHGAFNPETKDEKREVSLYTRYFINEEGVWERYQEFEGDSEKPRSMDDRRIPASEETFENPDDLPVLPQTFIDIPGEHYGHGHYEVALGDLRTLEGLYQALAEFSAIAAQVRFLIQPGGMTSMQDIADTENGGACPGREVDVYSLSTDKSQDMAWVQNSADRIEARLARHSLRTSSVQRDGERVTAEEVRLMAEDLERALGGAYSMLAARLQLPLVRLFTRRLTQDGRLSSVLADDRVSPVIIAGLEALGRSHKLQKLSIALGLLQSTIGPEALAYVNLGPVVTDVFTSAGLSAQEFVKTEEEVQQMLQQAQQAQIAEQAVPIATQAGADSAAQR